MYIHVCIHISTCTIVHVHVQALASACVFFSLSCNYMYMYMHILKVMSIFINKPLFENILLKFVKKSKLDQNQLKLLHIISTCICTCTNVSEKIIKNRVFSASKFDLRPCRGT